MIAIAAFAYFRSLSKCKSVHLVTSVGNNPVRDTSLHAQSPTIRSAKQPLPCATLKYVHPSEDAALRECVNL
jgi:hypothetical protein